MKISIVWMIITLRGIELLRPLLVLLSSLPTSHPLHQLALQVPRTHQYMYFHLRFFTSPLGLMFRCYFYLHPPHSMFFPFCLPLHSHLVFVWFSLPFLLSLSLNFTAFSAHVASWHVARLGRNIFILSQSDQHLFLVLLRVYKSLFHPPPQTAFPHILL